MSQYLQEGGTITTIDRFEVMLKDARENIKKMNLENVITILEEMQQIYFLSITRKSTMSYFRCGKRTIRQFLPHCIRLLPVGGILIVDDVLQGVALLKHALVFREDREQYTKE